MASCLHPLLLSAAALGAAILPGAAQDAVPAAGPPLDRAALVARLAKTQRTQEAPERVESFRAFLTLTPRATDGHAVQVRSWAMFALPHLIRFRVVDEPGEPERMFDGREFYEVTPAGVDMLRGREAASTRQEIQRQIRLARQVLHFLYLDRLVAALEEAEVREETHVPPGRGEPVRAVRVSGLHPEGYPLYRDPQFRGAVRLDLWLERETLEPIAVRARPAGAEENSGPQGGAAEEVRFFGPREVSGVLLPHELRLYEVTEAGHRVYRLQVVLSTVELNPSVTPADFRPR